MSKFQFRIEMKDGQAQRIVDADSREVDDIGGWLIFYRNPSIGGGGVECWRTRIDSIVSMETVRTKS